MSNPIFAAFALAIAPDPYLTIDEWADKFRQLPQGASAEAGQYNTDRMPYLREIMRELSPQSPTQQIKVMKGTQLGFTEIGNNMTLYYMDIVPASQLMILPTETLAKDHNNRKLEPSLRAMPYLASRITGGKTKDDVGGTFEKIYSGGMLKIAWAGSPANFRSLSCRIINFDDIDGFPQDVGSEGDPIDLGKKRADSFGSMRKIYINSTPTTAGASNIETEFEASDQRHYFMPCPFCKEFIKFEKDGFIFTYNKDNYTLTSEVQYSCQHCGSLIDEHYKTEMLLKGKWIAQNEHIHRGYRLPSYYSPIGFISWREIFTEFLEAKQAMNRGDVRKMKVWVNTRDAKPWEDEIDTVKIDNVETRVEEYDAEVPEGVLVLTAGVDTQDDRFEVEVVGYGKLEETWSVDYKVIYGDPNLLETRAALDGYLKRTFTCKDGAKMKIFAAAVDTGGHRTKAAYAFCKTRYLRRIFAIKGAREVNASFVKTRASKNNLAKINLFTIGVNTGKDEIYAKLEITARGAGYMHFPRKPQYDAEYFKQLTAEKRDKKTGRWEKYRHRNGAIDCRNYANAALLIAGIDDKILEKGKRIGVLTENTQKPKKEIRQGWSNGW
ncbi:MAG: phage terminase large subunit family protein [Campylobacteraceae bacterium]|jgi:phage terminase large subunit GpA-like protein|nr:phage terminase large subunit family protein [Campylobacteraceae bacterium]